MAEGEKVAEFIELRSAQDRAMLVCERVALHFERGQTVAVYAPDPEEADELDERLWTFRQNAFIPHVRLQDADDELVEPVVIFGEGADPVASDVLIIAGADELPDWVEQFAHVYDFAAVHDEALRRSSRKRFAECKKRGYRMRFIKP